MNIIVLMGKPNGGVRPIALMPMLYRLWTKTHKPMTQQWDSINWGKWDAAMQGSSALRAAILTTFGDEMARYAHLELLQQLTLAVGASPFRQSHVKKILTSLSHLWLYFRKQIYDG